jgi:hypothetical protein
MPLSLNRAAARNSARIRSAARLLVAGDRTGVLARFRAFAERSAFSTNVSADKIELFEAHGAILDARAIELARAGGARAAGLRAFRRRQAGYFTRRVRFEALWSHGRRFVYGAVNAGGMGPNDLFGPFCIVIADPSASAPVALGVVPDDSASRYCSLGGVVDRARALDEVVAWSDRADLVVVERESDALGVPPDGWAGAICRPRRYIEALVAPGPPLAGLDAVRLRGEHLDRLEDLRAAGIDNGSRSNTEARELLAFETLHRWRVAHALKIESVG